MLHAEPSSGAPPRNSSDSGPRVRWERIVSSNACRGPHPAHASCERCQGGLGKQGSVKARLRLTSSIDLSRPKPRAKAPPVTRGQNNQPAALGDAQLGRSAASSRRGDVPGGRDGSCHPPFRTSDSDFRLRGRPGATTGSKAQQRLRPAPNMAAAPAEGENLQSC